MKKLFMILALLAFTFGAYAQRPNVITALTVDTVTNTTQSFIAVGTFTSELPFAVQLLATNLTGTTAGTAVLEGSLDGTTYVPILDETNLLKAYPNDTMTIVDAAASTWIVLDNKYYKYRINVTPTGSHTTKLTGKVYYKK